MAERPRPDLGPVLRREADRHVPDRTAMLNRIAQRRAEPPRSRWALSLRPVAAAASVVATLVVGFTGIRLLGDRPEPDRTPAATEGSPSPAASATPPPSPSAAASSHAPRQKGGAGQRETGRATTATTAPGPGWTPSAGFLSSAAVVDSHSVSTWAQGNVTLTTTRTITALDLVINVAKTPGVRDAGRWTTIPAEMVGTVVTEEKDRLVYRFTLKQGTLAPGDYVFAVQYVHADGDRDPSGDTYGAVATADGEQVVVTGAFRDK
ncbi:hypothetical protein [Actinoplanes utahensis]|uniref:hypothetical protein n=1 Tax=Actinoplanes utahensis TaxID=1869 RepID=UPI00069022F7|nr:hypothetical protein [Actinoplanes utahensis]GIF28232.1 hypothetical protein Aut01nite_12180 [Actinoplanes utahensis]